MLFPGRQRDAGLLVIVNDLTITEMQFIRDRAATLVNEQSPSIFFSQRLIIHLLYVIPELRAYSKCRSLWNSVTDSDYRYETAMEFLRTCENILELAPGTGHLERGNLHDAVLHKLQSFDVEYIIASGIYAELISSQVPITVIHVDSLATQEVPKTLKQ